MKKLLLIIHTLAVSLLIISCSQKMPVPGNTNTGLLVIPVTSTNMTSFKYGYYYNFVYTPEAEVELRVVPLGSRSFVIIDNLPQGKYEISGIKTISSTNTDGGLPHIGSKTTDFSSSIPIEIIANSLTLLGYGLSIEQDYVYGNALHRYVQRYSFRPLDESQQNQLIAELQNLQNADLWNMDQLKAGGLPDSKTGVVSSGEAQLTWQTWNRR